MEGEVGEGKGRREGMKMELGQSIMMFIQTVCLLLILQKLDKR